MVRLALVLHAPSTRCAQDLLEALRFLAVGTRLEPGCVQCLAWTDADWTVRYVEEWATEADMRQRVRSDRFTSLLGVVESAQEPRVQFDFVTTSRGLDYVADVRADVPK
jgi:quinol monooxygenase YgiN